MSYMRIWGVPGYLGRKNSLVAADMLSDRVLPFFDEHEIPLLRILTDRGSEYCGNREDHDYQLYLVIVFTSSDIP
jgi:hypothetical protein